MPQSTGLVQITNTWVESGGTAPTQVVGGGLGLCMSMTIDQSLVGNGYGFDINWQVIEVATGRINNNWASKIFEHSSWINVDEWFSSGGDFTWTVGEDSNYFGVYLGSGGLAENNGTGMYVLRVYVFVDNPNDMTPPLPGTAQWAVSDDLYFWCD
jgi:hypothetical protein